MSALGGYPGSDSRVSDMDDTDILPQLTMFETSVPIAVQRRMI